MPATIRILQMRAKADPAWTVINACSNTAVDWQRDFSPFFLGPLWLYAGHWARRMENAWQYAKLYKEHADENGCPTEKYWEWAKAGWENPKAVRYPMGKGAAPLGSLWKGKKLSYVEARKAIYGPLYAESVQKTAGFAKLKAMYEEMPSDKVLGLRDFDGYDYSGLSLTQVLNNPGRKMGHVFVIAMLLLNDPALKEFDQDLRTPPGNPPWGT